MTEMVAGTVTAMDVKALRSCETVCFYHEGKHDGSIRCIKRVENPGPFDDSTRRHEFACFSSVQYFHRNDSTTLEYTGEYRCYSHVMGANWNDSALHTFCQFVRVGDELRLKWIGSNNNDSMRRNGLYRDECYVEIRRGEKRFLFLIDVFCGEWNTARMVQPKQ